MSRIRSVIDPSDIDLIISNHSEMDHSGSLPTVIDAVRPSRIVASKMGVKALSEHFGRTDIEGGMANGYAIVSDIQYRTHLETPGTGFVTGHDISGGLHPDWKRPLGERAALWALARLSARPVADDRFRRAPTA